MIDDDVRELLAEARAIPDDADGFGLTQKILVDRLASALEERVAFETGPAVVSGIIRSELRRDHGHRMVEPCHTCERRTEKLVDALARFGAFKTEEPLPPGTFAPLFEGFVNTATGAVPVPSDPPDNPKENPAS